MAVKVIHVPSHLAYVAKLNGGDFGPILSPAGRPLRVAELVRQPRWDLFDAVHLHTVELATEEDLLRLTARCSRERKRLVVTVHDLQPNIEPDRRAYASKLELLVERADAVITLTQAAAEALDSRGDLRVIPHGRAIGESAWPAAQVAQPGGPLVTFGALRPNRDLWTLVAAHQLLGDQRPAMKILLRSVSQADEDRDADLLAMLRRVAEIDEQLDVQVFGEMIRETELVEWLRGASALVLPYGTITHSGQLELARDVGLPVLAPNVPSLRAQLRESIASARHPVLWFAGDEFTADRFGKWMLAAQRMNPPTLQAHRAHRKARCAEHDQLLRAHARAYGCEPSGQ